MPERRAPRWVVWPAKLIWAPVFFTGLVLTIGLDLVVTRMEASMWRVDLFFPAPNAWAAHPWLFSIGIILLVFGAVLLAFYFWDPGPGRSLTLVEYPLFTWAAWIFGILAMMSLWSFDGHVTVLDGDGFAWRFLATTRVQVLDRVLTVSAMLAWIACWLGSWGLVPGRYAYRNDAAPQ